MTLSYSAQIDAMWKGVFSITSTPSMENILLASIALMALFMVLCFRRNLEPGEAFMVMLPLLLGITASNEMPGFVQNTFIIVPMVVIGYAVVKFFGAR